MPRRKSRNATLVAQIKKEAKRTGSSLKSIWWLPAMYIGVPTVLNLKDWWGLIAGFGSSYVTAVATKNERAVDALWSILTIHMTYVFLSGFIQNSTGRPLFRFSQGMNDFFRKRRRRVRRSGMFDNGNTTTYQLPSGEQVLAMAPNDLPATMPVAQGVNDEYVQNPHQMQLSEYIQPGVQYPRGTGTYDLNASALG